jgi:hypothetical protein
LDDVDIFVRQIRSRSIEHKIAVELLARADVNGQIVAVIRQEVDSLIRVVYLLSLPLTRRNELISESVGGSRWRKEEGRGFITDREMVDLSDRLIGWTRSVYKFGCAFIHLSSFHDYRNIDPVCRLPEAERLDLINHCRNYHGGPMSNNPTLDDFIPYLPRVFDKISSNLECYIEKLIAQDPPSMEF